MPRILAMVVDKIMIAAGTPTIVCGNSDYELQFIAFDSDWNEYEAKTAEFKYFKHGELRCDEIVFSGNTVSIPVLRDIDEVEIGVYAGNLRTSTGVRVPCIRCVTDGIPEHQPPAPDVYEQLLAYLEGKNADSAAGISELEFIGSDNSETGIADADYSKQYEAIMTITAKRGSDTLNLVQMSELNFYDGSDNKLVLQLANVTSSQPAYSAGQGAEMLIDNNTTTKYCALFVNPMTISIKSDSALDIAKFSYTTADDTPNRDPVSFTLQYSSDYGETFNTILTVENATITTSRKTETQQWACS